MQVNINMDKELIDKIDERAKKLYLSRSAYISMAVSKMLQNDELSEQLPKLFKNFNDFVLTNGFPDTAQSDEEV